MNIRLLLPLLISAGSVYGGELLKFERLHITDETYEAACAFDVDKDGHIDIASGAFWYAGPEFVRRYKIGDIQPASEWWDDFFEYPMDGNGWLDILAPGKEGLYLFRNQGWINPNLAERNVGEMRIEY